MPDLISPWQPEQDPSRLKALGKLSEECNELGSAIARCIIQGIDEAEPITGKLNRQWLIEEIADVLANIDIVMEHFELNGGLISMRQGRKHRGIKRWLAGLTKPEQVE